MIWDASWGTGLLSESKEGYITICLFLTGKLFVSTADVMVLKMVLLLSRYNKNCE